MQELFLLSAILCLITEGAPFAGDKEGNGGEDVQSIWVDQGSNLTLPCGGLHVRDGGSVMWIHEDRRSNITSRIQDDGSIFFPSLTQSDSGVYECRIDSDSSNYQSRRKLSSQDLYEARVRIRVRTPPHVLKNVTVTPYTIFALVMWEIDKDGDGGYSIRSFQIAYRLKNAAENDWKTCLPAYIDPLSRQYNIYHLQPNSTYLMKVWANNALGSGQSKVVEVHTQNDLQEIELGKHFLDGVDSFDVRIWIIAVGIVISTLLILGVATCCLFYKEYNMNLATDSRDMDGESIELMPNIILNPGYDFQPMELTQPDENSNDTTALRINNNSVVHPARV